MTSCEDAIVTSVVVTDTMQTLHSLPSIYAERSWATVPVTVSQTALSGPLYSNCCLRDAVATPAPNQPEQGTGERGGPGWKLSPFPSNIENVCYADYGIRRPDWPHATPSNRQPATNPLLPPKAQMPKLAIALPPDTVLSFLCDIRIF
ncbi:hypothetical protein E2C01_016108 [Portunus trituberculatus]|uniref:Uncharacterized protein n=1 Tax=Portunus trituberculatus TaxID=210409 RepID=A0A5B7DNJ7_PORTR|nr:hypothetical protein [Portunus trituberculatus]